MMKNKLTVLSWAILIVGCTIAQPVARLDLKEKFKNPPFEFRAIYPFQGAGGADANYKESESVHDQLDKIYNQYGFGGIIISPTHDKPFVAKQISEPGYNGAAGVRQRGDISSGQTVQTYTSRYTSGQKGCFPASVTTDIFIFGFLITRIEIIHANITLDWERQSYQSSFRCSV
jgi:hypothetical protein